MAAFDISEPARRRALVLLVGISVLNYLDRNVIGILMPSIKSDLSLSDTEIGFITGIGFSLFYATMGIPIARLADRSPRKTVLALALAAWSAMTAACGAAMSFVQFAIARVLVGVGEAGASPPSHSLIADIYPPERRARALGILTIGAPVGQILGLLLGGVAAQTFGWRAVLIGLAVPGVIIAVIASRYLPDPPRGHADGLATEAQPALGHTLKTLLSRPTFVHNSMATGVFAGVWYGMVYWLPSFFNRTHQIPLMQIGMWLAGVTFVSQVGGAYIGGVIADRLAVRDKRWLMWMCCLTVLGSAPFYVFVFLTSMPILGFVVLVVPFFLNIMQGAPQYAVVQGVAPPAMRSTAAAVYLLIVSVVSGLGLQAIGILSDSLKPTLGDNALGRALLMATVVGCAWSATHYWLAARHLPKDFGRPA